MKRTTALICFLFCAFACGAPIESDELDVDALREEAAEDAEDFADLQSAVLVQEFYGVRDDLADSNTRCADSGAGPATQKCFVPPNKAVTYRVTGTGMTAAQKSDAESKVDGFIATFSGQFPTWTLTRSTASSDVNISYGALNSGSPKTSIHRYVNASISGNSLGAPAFGGTGTWLKANPMDCKIDRPRIIADFTAVQQPIVLRHALGVCMGFGIGLGTGGAVARPNAIAVTENTVKSTNFSNFAKCLVNKYDPGTPDFFSLTFDCEGQTDN